MASIYQGREKNRIIKCFVQRHSMRSVSVKEWFSPLLLVLHPFHDASPRWIFIVSRTAVPLKEITVHKKRYEKTRQEEGEEEDKIIIHPNNATNKLFPLTITQIAICKTFLIRSTPSAAAAPVIINKCTSLFIRLSIHCTGSSIQDSPTPPPPSNGHQYVLIASIWYISTPTSCQFDCPLAAAVGSEPAREARDTYKCRNL